MAAIRSHRGDAAREDEGEDRVREGRLEYVVGPRATTICCLPEWFVPKWAVEWVCSYSAPFGSDKRERDVVPSASVFSAPW